MLPENFFEKLAEKDTLFKKGRVKGRAEAQKEIAQTMKNLGFEKNVISKMTKVPISVINNL